MNRRLADPLSLHDYPSKLLSDKVLECDDSHEILCMAFHPAGTYVAAGTARGDVLLFDIATLSLSVTFREMQPDATDISSISWLGTSVDGVEGRYLCTTSVAGQRLRVYDALEKRVVKEARFQHGVARGVMDERFPDFALMTWESAPKDSPIWPQRHPVPLAVSGGPVEVSTPTIEYKNASLTEQSEDFKKLNDKHRHTWNVVAAFSRTGRFVLVGGLQARVSLFEAVSGATVGDFGVGSGLGKLARVVKLVVSQSGRSLTVDCGGYKLLTFDFLDESFAPSEETGKHALDASATVERLQGAMKWRAGKILTYRRQLEDAVDKSRWADVHYTPHEHVVALSGANDVHKLFFWDPELGVGKQVGTSRTPGTRMSSFVWHPWRNLLVSLSDKSQLYVWVGTDQREGSGKVWLAFPPGFQEVHENVVYEEREDEFTQERFDYEASLPIPGSTTDPRAKVESDEVVNVLKPMPVLVTDDFTPSKSPVAPHSSKSSAEDDSSRAERVARDTGFGLFFRTSDPDEILVRGA